MSFLEMLDVVNEGLITSGKEPIAFDHDCREGICGMCGVVINGRPHGPERPRHHLPASHAQLSRTATPSPSSRGARPPSRSSRTSSSIAAPFDRIIQSGGFIAASTGSAPDANASPVPKAVSDMAMDAAACIGCGACVAACPNGAAQLFTSAKVAHLNVLPQGQPERWARVTSMVDTMEEYFGSCTNFAECEAVCPKGISINFIARMNRDYLKAKFKDRRTLVRAADVAADEG